MSERLVPAGYLNAARLEKFAEASGDNNPIHLNEEIAKRAGLPGVIVHGMLSASLLSSMVCEWLGRERSGARLTSLRYRFRAMVARDESLVLRAEPSGECAIEFSAQNARGELVVSGSAEYAR